TVTKLCEILISMSPTLRRPAGLRFFDPARSGPVFGDARGDHRGGVVAPGPVGAWRLPDDLGEPGAERSERGTADLHAHVGHGKVAAAQQRHGPLDPPGHQVAVR